MGLELMGWLFFLPISSFFAAIFLFLVSNLKVKILGMGFVVAITHLLFQTDEKTGVMNITLFVERIKWLYFSEKIITPTWSEDSERISTLQITVKKERNGDS